MHVFNLRTWEAEVSSRLAQFIVNAWLLRATEWDSVTVKKEIKTG